MTSAQGRWPLIARFIRTWKTLARYSWVDEWGSAEQRRVLAEWIAAGHPAEVRQFIVRHANTAPEART